MVLQGWERRWGCSEEGLQGDQGSGGGWRQGDRWGGMKREEEKGGSERA